MILALLFGSCVGIPLGLTGGGGSIFAVPLLIYGLGFGFQEAVALSLGIVAATAMFGALIQQRTAQVLWMTGLVLGLGGISGVPLGAKLGELISERTSLLLFSALMLYIATRALVPHFGPRTPTWMQCQPSGGSGVGRFPCVARLLVAGFGTGILSGLFGVGGGFLLIAALLAVAQAPIHQATATSLVSIVVIATAGFITHLDALRATEPLTAALFLGGSAGGMLLGVAMKRRLSARTLQLLFGFSVLGTALFIVARNI